MQAPLNYNHTFVIPAYKQSPHIEECIQSLLSQTVKSKILITTATPSDFLACLANKYRLPYCVNQKGGSSIGTDWNFALSQASTSLVTIAHQDDIYLPAYTNEILKTFEQQTGSPVQLFFTGYQDLVDGQPRLHSKNAWIKKVLLWPYLIKSSISSRFLKKVSLCFGDPICCPSVTLNMNLLKGFVFDEGYTCALDWLAWYQLSQRTGSFVYIPQKLIVHRIHADSETTAQLVNGRRKKEERAIFRKIWGGRLGNWFAGLYAHGHKDNLL